ncbi:DUF2149 domain-containing protein [Conexibacter sp. JD483]|uniref:DUF2149 domain-containing protein n=1 Tax=unclassified Conexibacter TaxID=2627773 RepID=UPI0027248BAE|nr:MULTISPECIES: DUF2149 domain-containing protein [unclassified Conexibacter]MDO8187594.1 DUF2149 domain-containing protein [Conexibacter sp. CPCC 205706]MDO8201074.1 DUF2149 domain-containing protein [Conexibacter sp. CPCC 205762]MDR9371821.1 DUF2149 domain-containing protein [Conexibacter sp. JD483]
MSRIGFGRHGGLDDAAGDPLDGLVNLFDVGIVLAVAFLIAGLGLTSTQRRAATGRPQPADQQQRSLPSPANAPQATGRGRAVGKVYRLPDGRLVYVEDGR